MRVPFHTLRATALVVLLAAGTAGCAARQVEVGTGTAMQVSSAVRVTNTLDQPVNVYVVSGESETFVRQVGRNATELVEVRGVSPDALVTLRARTVDGRRSYTSDPITLGGTPAWRVP